MWRVKIDGTVYGPVTRAELDEWVADERLDGQSQLLAVGADQWQWASELYPDLPAEIVPDDSGEAAKAASVRGATSGRWTVPESGLPESRPAAGKRRADRRDRWRDDSEESDVADDEADGAEEVSDRRWITTFLLAFFLGALGVHRFYLGRVATGVAMLFTCGGCFVWQVVDVVLIALEKLPDHLDRPLKK